MSAVDIARGVPIERELERRGYCVKRKGNDLAGPCPVCGGDDRFVVTPKKGVWCCRGCGAGGDVIALVQHIDKVDFLEAVECLAGERPQYEDAGGRAAQNMIERERKAREQEQQSRRESEAKTERAVKIWSEGVCVWDTPAQTYLTSRRCEGLFPPDRDAVFRFHPECPFGRGPHLPCLLTLLRNVETDEPQAVQRTALTPDGEKIGRLTLGPKTGAAAKFWPQSCVTNRLALGEGTETVLSAALHLRHRGEALTPAWAAIDADNLKLFPVLADVQQLIILVDNDVRGMGQEKARECSSRWVRAGKKVRRLTPNKQGADFNDILVVA